MLTSAKEHAMTIDEILAELEAVTEEDKERSFEEKDWYQDYLDELYW